MVDVLLDALEVREGVTLVELEVGREERVGEPDVGEGDEQTFVKVVRDATAVLDLHRN